MLRSIKFPKLWHMCIRWQGKLTDDLERLAMRPEGADAEEEVGGPSACLARTCLPALQLYAVQWGPMRARTGQI